MELREKAERALALRVLADELLTQAKYLAEQVAEDMRQIGSDRVTVADSNLDELGKLIKNPDKKVWGITDPIAFKQWVEANRPEHLTTAVSPAYVKWVLDQAEEFKGVVGDPVTGEMIPGIGQETKIGTFMVRKSAIAKQRAAAVVESMMSAGVAALPPVDQE